MKMLVWTLSTSVMSLLLCSVNLRKISGDAMDITQLLDEKGIGGELETLGAVRLQPEELEISMHAGLGDAALAGRPAHAPVRGAVLGLLIESFTDQARDLFILDRARSSGSQLIVESIDTVLHEPSAPLANGRIGQLKALRHRAVGITGRARQHNACSLRQRRSDRARACNRAQLRFLSFAQDPFRFWSA